MIDSIQNVSSLSFTRQMGGVETSGSSSVTEMPGIRPDMAVQGAGPDFETTLASMAGDMVGNLRAAEQASVDGITGAADTRAVVDAVMQAEQTLQTAIAIRDKIVSAYLEITRMQI